MRYTGVVSTLLQKLRWPRGRYNGRRIGGVALRFRMNLLTWYWLPSIAPPREVRLTGTLRCNWLCFNVWIEPYYEERSRFDRPSRA